MGIKKILFQLVVGTLNFETLFSLHAVIDKNKKDKSAKKITQYSTENDTDDQEMDNIEVAIRNAHEPLELAEEREEIEVSGLRGRQVNIHEERNWRDLNVRGRPIAERVPPSDHRLVGDVYVLRTIDLDRFGLGHYRAQIFQNQN